MGGLVFLLFLLAMDLTIIVGVRGYVPEARLFPWVIGIPTLVLLVWQIVIEIQGKGKPRKETPLERQVIVPSKQLIFAGLWLVGALAGVYLFGFLIAVTGYVLLYLIFHREKLLMSIVFGLSLFLFMQFIIYLLGTPFYGGLIYRLME